MKKNKLRIVKKYSHSKKKPRGQGDMWVSGMIMQPWPIVRVSPIVWSELMLMAKYSTGEFSALLRIEETEPKEYAATAWFLPEQITTEGSVDLTQPGALQIMRELGDDMEHYWGCFHIHPGIGATVPQMSFVDIATMWNWVKAAKRGIFIVSNESGYASAMLLEELKDGRALQSAMRVEVGWDLEAERTTEIEELFDERVQWATREEEPGWMQQWNEHIY